MSSMTITVGTGLHGGANRSGYVHDGLTQYPDLAFTAGYVFRGGTGWWQEWEALFTTYPQQSASDNAANYQNPIALNNAFNSTTMNLGTGWNSAWKTLFWCENSPLYQPDVNGYTDPTWRLGFRNSPPFVGKPKFIPQTCVYSGRFDTARAWAWCLFQSDVAQRATLVPGPVAGSYAMQFTGVESYGSFVAGATFGSSSGFTKAFIAVFKTSGSGATPQAIASISTAGPDDKYAILATVSGQSAGWLALSAAPGSFYNAVPSSPSVFVNDGNWHIAGLAVSTNSTLSPWMQTDSFIQDFSLPSAMRNTAALTPTFTVGKSLASGWNFSGELLEVTGFSATIATQTRSNFVSVLNVVKGSWGL